MTRSALRWWCFLAGYSACCWFHLPLWALGTFLFWVLACYADVRGIK